jgi:HD superfamily phosphohydrolase
MKILVRMDDKQSELMADLMEDLEQKTATKTILMILEEYTRLKDMNHDYRQKIRNQNDKIKELEEKITEVKEAFNVLRNL